MYPFLHYPHSRCIISLRKDDGWNIMLISYYLGLLPFLFMQHNIATNNLPDYLFTNILHFIISVTSPTYIPMCKYCCLRRSMINRGRSFVTLTNGPRLHRLNYNVMYDSPRWVHIGVVWEWMCRTSWAALSYLLPHLAAPFRCCSQSRVSIYSRSSASSSRAITNVAFSLTK